MSERFRQLTARHIRLLARSAAQREQLVDAAGEIEDELGRVDRGIDLVRRGVRNPAFVIGGVALIALLGPRRLLGWAARGMMVYTTARQLLALRRDDKLLK